MRTDIIRGVRMGVILLTILFGGVVGYRIFRPAPSAISPVAVPAATAPDVNPAKDPGAPAVSPQVTAEVPPPPPVAGSAPRRTARRNLAPKAPVEKIILVDPALAVEETPQPLQNIKAVEAPRPDKPETALVVTSLVKPEPAPTPQTQPAVVANDAGPKTDAHGKGVVKAFRRFLHLPKKDAQPEMLKQP